MLPLLRIIALLQSIYRLCHVTAFTNHRSVTKHPSIVPCYRFYESSLCYKASIDYAVLPLLWIIALLQSIHRLCHVTAFVNHRSLLQSIYRLCRVTAFVNHRSMLQSIYRLCRVTAFVNHRWILKSIHRLCFFYRFCESSLIVKKHPSIRSIACAVLPFCESSLIVKKQLLSSLLTPLIQSDRVSLMANKQLVLNQTMKCLIKENVYARTCSAAFKLDVVASVCTRQQ